MATVDAPARPFESLADLRTEHLRLLRQTRAAGGVAAVRAEVDAFLDRAQAVGARLDAAADREAAQGILDYWTAALLTAVGGGPPSEQPRLTPPRALAEFDAAAAGRVSEAAELAVAAMTPAEQELARRLLLRLVELAPEGRAFNPVRVPRGELESVGDPARVGPVLGALERAGVFRISQEADGPVYALRSEALTRVWPRYAAWLDKRARFRDQVRYWEKNRERADQGRAALISGPLLSDALAYHDLNGTEKEYLNRSRDREARQKRVWQVLFAAALLLFVVAVIGWVAAATQRKRAVKETEAAEKARLLETEARGKAEEAQRQVQEKGYALAVQHESRLKRDVVTNLVGLLQSLSRDIWAGDNDAERALSRRRWADLMTQSAQLIADLGQAETDAARLAAQPGPAPDEPLAPTLQKLYDELRGVYAEFGKPGANVAPSVLRERSYAALRMGQQVKARVVKSSDPVAVSELERMRSATFNFVQVCAAQIVRYLDDGNYEAALPFIREFWILYWGEMGLLEGNQVLRAMREFGEQLGKVDQVLQSRLAQDVKDRWEAKWPGRGQAYQDFWYKVSMSRGSGQLRLGLKNVALTPALKASLKAAAATLDSALEHERGQSMADDLASFGQKGD
jgi:hypothetical protein